MKENKWVGTCYLFKKDVVIPDNLYYDNILCFLEEIRKSNPQHAYTIDLLNMKKPKRVWEAMAGQYEDGGKLTDNDYRERIKKFLLWRTISPEESTYIKNFKM